jgi:hypothetical protein
LGWVGTSGVKGSRRAAGINPVARTNVMNMCVAFAQLKALNET